MVWRYVGLGESIPGVPKVDMSDEEFAAAAATYAEQWPEEDRAEVLTQLRNSPLYVHEAGKPETSKPAKAPLSGELPPGEGNSPE